MTDQQDFQIPSSPSFTCWTIPQLENLKIAYQTVEETEGKKKANIWLFQRLLPNDSFNTCAEAHLDNILKINEIHYHLKPYQLVICLCWRLCEYYLSQASTFDADKRYLLELFWSHVLLPVTNPFFEILTKIQHIVKALTLQSQNINITLDEIFHPVDMAHNQWKPVVESWLIEYMNQIVRNSCVISGIVDPEPYPAIDSLYAHSRSAITSNSVLIVTALHNELSGLKKQELDADKNFNLSKVADLRLGPILDMQNLIDAWEEKLHL